MNGLTEGRIVHFVMSDGEHRPAIVVKVWNKQRGIINLTVFTDWQNDGFDSGIKWATSIIPDLENKQPNTWHWIEQA